MCTPYKERVIEEAMFQFSSNSRASVTIGFITGLPNVKIDYLLEMGDFREDPMVTL